ncbi:F-box only protein 47-like, partial [Diretmus argenteus]
MGRSVKRSMWTHTAQRSRRARRPYPVRTVITRSQGNTSCFQRLPAEVFHMILDRLSVLEISVFSTASKAIGNSILGYVSSPAWRNKMITQSIHHPTSPYAHGNIKHYEALGWLFKRCTQLLPTEDRLTLISSTFSQMPCFKLEECTAAGCLGFYGVSCSLELQLRLFCRQVLLDPLDPLDPWLGKDTLFWLTRILKPWPMVLQARLLFILYGPLMPDGTLAWQGMVEREMSHSDLWYMARVIILLYRTDWTTDTMQTILEELIVFPEVWHMENVARLLMLCGNPVCYSFLANKAHNGQLLEVSRLIVHIILVCEKDGYSMNWVVRMVHQVCQGFNTSERFAFIQRLEDMFSEVTMELIEIVTAEKLLGFHFWTMVGILAGGG